jgi:hypothetical protein
MSQSKFKEKVVKLPKTLIPFQLMVWCENFFIKNKRIPTQKEIEEANTSLTKESLIINSTYGVTPILNRNKLLTK